jgi:proteasome lid subunit RPN8/RPN11
MLYLLGDLGMILIIPEVFKSLQHLAEINHPNEIIVLLRGKKLGEDFHITDFLIPPFGVYGRGFASFPSHMLPIDFTIVGTAHSHPNGLLKPSIGDFHNFYGSIMMIFGPPYHHTNVAAYNKQGKNIPVKLSSLRQ